MVTLNINGRSHRLDVDRDTPLLWALRDELQFVGTKFGCGRALCGACTVHIDGEAARSCSIMVGEAEGKAIVTIEGLSGDVATAVKDAWVKAAVPQCGYCQPGFVMATASILSKDRSQDKEAVLSQIANICRCGTYDAIRAAVALALETLKTVGSNPAKAGDSPMTGQK
jgi:isoquinoline 1-oxidoreductase subunit alpha